MINNKLTPTQEIIETNSEAYAATSKRRSHPILEEESTNGKEISTYNCFKKLC